MVARILILAALLAGCEKRSELYCEKNPEDLAHCPRSDAPDVPLMMCTDNASCTTVAKPFCEPGSHVCVGCLSNADCTDPTKLNCDPRELECRGCVAHSDCPTDACLPGGVCGDDGTVVYVDPAGSDMNDGSKLKPVKTMTAALKLVTTTRKYMKLTGTLSGATVIMSKEVVIITDPGTRILGTGDPAFKINDSQVTIFGLEIECSGAMNCVRVEAGSTGRLYGVYVHGAPKTGIEAKSSYLELAQSTVADNLDGILTDGNSTFAITNNFIIHNGSSAATHGGVELGSSSPVNRFEFNTVAHNHIKDGLIQAAGVTCPFASLLTIPNNLIIANTGSVGNTTSCDIDDSADDGDAVPYAFKSIVAPYDYHITESSKAIGMATTMSNVTNDFDGEFRPQGPQKDLGADEYRAP